MHCFLIKFTFLLNLVRMLSQSKTCLWYKRFKDGRTSVDDDERSGRPSTSTTPENIAKVRKAIVADRRRTIHDVCAIVGM
jgi:histone-lysine N-methyltransferase SETMAR